MIAADAVALVLLAAGASSRFGSCDKLAQPLAGLPLGLHAARTLEALPFASRIVVTRQAGLDFAAYGFTSVANDDPASGQSGSIRLGLALARLTCPNAVLIVLADMPFVTISHIEALLAKLDPQHPVVASTDGTHMSPPALFHSSLFETLRTLSGDSGARALLRSARPVRAPSSELADIDTPGDLRRVLAR